MTFGALHAEGNYSSGYCSGLAPDSLSALVSAPLVRGQGSLGITICAAKLQQNVKSEKRKSDKKLHHAEKTHRSPQKAPIQPPSMGGEN